MLVRATAFDTEAKSVPVFSNCVSQAPQHLTLRALNFVQHYNRRMLIFTAANKYSVPPCLVGDPTFLHLLVTDITHLQLPRYTKLHLFNECYHTIHLHHAPSKLHLMQKSPVP